MIIWLILFGIFGMFLYKLMDGMTGDWSNKCPRDASMLKTWTLPLVLVLIFFGYIFGVAYVCMYVL